MSAPPSTPPNPGPLDPAHLPNSIRGYARLFTRAYLLGGVCLALFQLLLNRIDWLSKDTVDRIFASGGSVSAAYFTGALMIGLGIVAFALRLASRWYLFNAGRDAEYALRSQLLHKLHRLGTSFYRRVPAGEIMSRATADLGQVRLLFGFGVLQLLNVIFSFSSALQVMTRISPRLTVAAFLTLPLTVLFTRAMSRRMFAQSRVNQADLGQLGDLAQRHIAGIRVVRSFAIERYAERRFDEASQRYLGSSLKLSRVRGAMFPILGGMNSLSLLIVAWYGASLLHLGASQPGGLSPGDFFAFLLAWARMAWPMTAFGLTLAVLQRGRACFARIREILDAAPDVVEPEVPAPPAAIAAPGLKVEALRYEAGDRTLLDGVSFNVPAGRSLAIVGRTGSGKSTLAMLLVRLLPTPRGSVFLDGRDVCDLDRASLRARIGYAQQDPFLFSSSVAENVAIGLDLPVGAAMPADELAAALRDAQITSEVAALPDGEHTLVGERGVQLSGGQRQRVALARALVSHTPLLILDDPLSAVDARTEAAILDALRRRAELRSLVLITNRISAAARCDEILVLEEGRIAQRGSHAELVAQSGLYAALAEEQRVEGELAELADLPAPEVATPVRTGAPSAARAAGDDVLPIGTDLRLVARIWPFLRKERRPLLAALLLLGIVSLGALLRPLVMGALTTAALKGSSLVQPGLALFAVLSTIQLCVFGQNYLIQLAGARSMATLRMTLFRFTDRLGMRVFDRTPVGRLVTRLVNDVDAIGEVFASGAVSAVGDVLTIGTIVVVMIALDWQLALIAFAAIPASVLLVSRLRRGARAAYRDVRTTTAQLNAMLNEQVAGVAVVQAFGREAAMAARFDKTNVQYRDANKRAILSESALDAAIEMVQTICVASVLLWSGHVVARGGAITFAVVVTFQQYLRQFFEPISMLAQRFTALQLGLASAERIFDFLDTPDREPDEAPGPVATHGPEESNEHIALDQVRFAYREGHPVLDDVSLSARRGERIAIVGPTGAGKSTITQLLLRMYDADRGAVRVMGRDVRGWSRAELRRCFAVVPQEVMIFSGTLLENIALGDDKPDRARAERALAHLGIRETFLARQGGLDARVDERGLNFSAGERQLLSFARAVYNDAPILLLDEATASVDSHTEARIQSALEHLLVGRTALVIAHRLSTIESADRIVVLQHGHVVEEGKHEQLLAAGGLYARLHALQTQRARIVGAA